MTLAGVSAEERRNSASTVGGESLGFGRFMAGAAGAGGSAGAARFSGALARDFGAQAPAPDLWARLARPEPATASRQGVP